MIRRLLFLLALLCGSPLSAVSTSTSVPHASRSTPTSKASGLGDVRCFFPSGTFGPPAWQASVRSTLENLIDPASRVARNPHLLQLSERITGSFSAAKNGAPQLSHDSVLDLDE